MAMTEQQNMMRRLQVQCFVLDDVKLFLTPIPMTEKPWNIITNIENSRNRRNVNTWNGSAR